MGHKVLVLHGPNLNLLGRREPEVYGRTTLEEINQHLVQVGLTLGVEVECRQSNSEGVLLDAIGEAPQHFGALILNPGALAHTSIALRDAVLGVGLPTFEVHLTNIYAREAFRRRSYVGEVCVAVICGLGPYGYEAALRAAVARLMA